MHIGACTQGGSLNKQVVLHLQVHYMHCKLTSGLITLGTGLEVGVDICEVIEEKASIQHNTGVRMYRS